MNYRPAFGGEEAFAEDVVGNLGQTLKFMFAQFDALRGSIVRCVAVAMNIDVAKPKAGWYVLFRVRLMTLNTLDWTPVMPYRRRALQHSLESCHDRARGGPGRGGLL